MNKLHRWLLLSALALAVIGAAVYGFLVLAVVQVIPGYGCAEFDQGGFPYGLKYQGAGFIQGAFNYTGAPTNGTGYVIQTFYDTCVSNATLIEFVCGGSLSPSYNNVAGAVQVNCNEPGVGTGSNTTCVTSPMWVGGPLAGRCT